MLFGHFSLDVAFKLKNDQADLGSVIIYLKIWL